MKWPQSKYLSRFFDGLPNTWCQKVIGNRMRQSQLGCGDIIFYPKQVIAANSAPQALPGRGKMTANFERYHV